MVCLLTGPSLPHFPTASPSTARLPPRRRRRGLRPTTLCAHARPLRALAEQHGVEMDLGRGRCVLHGREDGAGSWGRDGRRLARLAVALLTSGLFVAHEGVADVRLGDGRYRFHLGTEVLGHLGAQEGEPAAVEAGAPAEEGLGADLVRLRRQGAAQGWRWQRLPEAFVYQEGVLLPDAVVQRPEGTVALFLPATAPAARTLRRVLARLRSDGPAVVLAPPSLMPLLAGSPAPVLPGDAPPAEILAALTDAAEPPIAGVG